MDDFKYALVSLRKAFADYNNGLLNNKKKLTPDFNAFSTLGCLELQLSRMIGELLNPKGSHSQEDLFLNLFIDMFLPSGLLPKEAEQINFKLEQSDNDKGRIDFLIDFNDFGIGFENKPYATDLDAQVVSYCKYLSSRYGDRKFIFIYLSRDGSLPSENSLPKQERQKLGNRFVVVSYKQLGKWCIRCAVESKKVGANRLAILLEEFSEFITREFLGVNTLKNSMLGETIEKNILEAYEINMLWRNNHEEYEKHWQETINRLFNKKLPKLVFDRLKKDGVIGDRWEFIEGRFDINILHVEGFKLKKKSWKHFSIGILSDRFKREVGRCGIFPAILSGKPISAEMYNERYCEKTGSKLYEKPFLKKPQTQWYGDFPKDDYKIWGYEQWAGIKPGGDTVNYVADFLKKLIKACEADIDRTEELLQGA